MCRGAGGRFSLNSAERESGRGASSRTEDKPLVADGSLVPTGCYDQLPAFGGVLGVGFFFTVASPETKSSQVTCQFCFFARLLSPRRMQFGVLALHGH